MCVPVVAFLAELLFEVAQGEAVCLHHAPVGDLLTTEEVCDHSFIPMAARRLLWLFWAVGKDRRGGEVCVRERVHKHSLHESHCHS